MRVEPMLNFFEFSIDAGLCRNFRRQLQRYWQTSIFYAGIATFPSKNNSTTFTSAGLKFSIRHDFCLFYTPNEARPLIRNRELSIIPIFLSARTNNSFASANSFSSSATLSFIAC